MHELERTWKVGELARATGLTIRALHHYDEIGLLVPARTESGHRVYSASDVERLYRIVALRGVGMALDEIAAVLDDAGVGLIDTVRRHVAAVERDIARRQRLLGRLRDMLDALERSATPSVDELIGTVEAMSVVEARIEDVVTREPWQAAWELTASHVVLLRESGGDRILPIWIGEPEATALVLQRRGATLPRPLGPDLTVALLGAIDASVERVVIERLRDQTFFATVTVIAAGEPREVDSRPSDALNLAARAGAAIHVASDVIETAGLRVWPDEIESPGRGQPPWTPLSAHGSTRSVPSYSVDENSPPMLRLAAAEARRLGHSSIAAPHVLLGILADAESSAARLLARHGLTLAVARAAAMQTPGQAQDASAPATPMPVGTSATFAMHRATVEARRRGSGDARPMHLLLALLDPRDPHRVPGLDELDVEAVRADVLAALDA